MLVDIKQQLSYNILNNLKQIFNNQTEMTEERMTARNRELVLPPRTQAFVLDSTKGRISVYVGPSKTSMSETDQLVIWDEQYRRFVPANDMNRAIMTWAEAREGQYIVLNDPVPEGSKTSPPHGAVNEAVDLTVGRQVIIPGPTSFPLWPGQSVKTIDGHRMATNQYVVVRVRQPEEAQKNWSLNTMHGLDLNKLETGQLFIIKGTEVSFYIPTTGLEVVPDADGKFVRNAVTLEQLEYCILLSENGKKRYVRGPAVVFPEPTEIFVVESNQRKFHAVELSPQSGIYVKVTAEYEEDKKQYKVGDELFITGNETAFYFPRAEHSVIKYGEHTKHHAIAIPEGEGRYVLDRNKGIVSLVCGPKMFLPNPINEVVVKRVLAPDMVKVMYPGNKAAIEINEKYAQEYQVSNYTSGPVKFACCATGDTAMFSANAADFAIDRSVFGDKTTDRGTTYTKPRTLVLDTKYEGAVSVNIWPGYAVCIVDKSGNRRVEVGPKNILLEYDEDLMVLELSSGCPKKDTSLIRTCYLRTVENAISDVVNVETSDMVPLNIKLSYRVNFIEGVPANRNKWFEIENYVKVLTDHCRSKLRNVVKQHSMQLFYANAITIVRDCLLGVKTELEPRTGLKFDQNNMHLYEVEVLKVDILSPAVAELFNKAAYSAIEGAIEVAQAKEQLTNVALLEGLRRSNIQESLETTKAEVNATIAKLELEAEKNNRTAANELAISEHNFQIAVADNKCKREIRNEELDYLSDKNNIELMRKEKEVALREKLAKALTPGMIEAMTSFGDKNFVEGITRSLAPAALAAGVNTSDILAQIFKNTPMEGILSAMGKKPLFNRLIDKVGTPSIPGGDVICGDVLSS
jgi:major vault protein